MADRAHRKQLILPIVCGDLNRFTRGITSQWLFPVIHLYHGERKFKVRASATTPHCTMATADQQRFQASLFIGYGINAIFAYICVVCVCVCAIAFCNARVSNIISLVLLHTQCNRVTIGLIRSINFFCVCSVCLHDTPLHFFFVTVVVVVVVVVCSWPGCHCYIVAPLSPTDHTTIK